MKPKQLFLIYFLNGPNPTSFCLFLFFSHEKCSTKTIIEKSIDSMLGTQTQGGRMVSTDESTELWDHPYFLNISTHINYVTYVWESNPWSNK